MTPFKKWIWIQTGIISGIVLVVGIAVFAMTNDIDGRVLAVQQKREELDQRNRAFAALALLRSQDAKAGPYQSILENALPDQDGLLNFANDMKSLARSRNLGFGFSFGGETDATAVEPGASAFRLSVSGPYNAVLAFFSDLNKSKYLISFTDTEIEQKEKAVEALANGQVFFR